jgi:hypothetical protein
LELHGRLRPWAREAATFVRKEELQGLWRAHQPTFVGAAVGLTCAVAAFLLMHRLEPRPGQPCAPLGKIVVLHFASGDDARRLVCIATDNGPLYKETLAER